MRIFPVRVSDYAAYLESRNLSRRTICEYSRFVKKFLKSNCDPIGMTQRRLKAYVEGEDKRSMPALKHLYRYLDAVYADACPKSRKQRDG